jgi:hypothetical protein
MRPILLAAASGLLLLSQPLWSKPAASAAVRPARLEGMEYLKARRIILGYGWRPFRGACSGVVGPQSCARFPEIDNCSGTGEGLCSMAFARGGRCLILVTAGSAPADQPGDTVVRDVTFNRGVCERSRPD